MSNHPTWIPSVPFWSLRGVRNKNLILATPAPLFDFWKTHSANEFPNLDVSERAYALSMSGLMDFVKACSIRKSCVLPSVAADSIWHAWLAWDQKSFNDFFQSRMGCFPSHTSSADMDVPLGLGIQNTWLALSVLDKVMPTHQHMPALFKLDRKVLAPGGWAYGWWDGDVFHSKILSNRSIDKQFKSHPDLNKSTLLAAFAIFPGAEAIIKEHLESAKHSKNGNEGSSGGDGNHFVFDANDSSDGGDGDGGGSCGGGGGGGCGD